MGRQEQLIRDLKLKCGQLERWKRDRQDQHVGAEQVREQLAQVKRELADKLAYTKQLRESYKAAQEAVRCSSHCD